MHGYNIWQKLIEYKRNELHTALAWPRSHPLLYIPRHRQSWFIYIQCRNLLLSLLNILPASLTDFLLIRMRFRSFLLFPSYFLVFFFRLPPLPVSSIMCFTLGFIYLHHLPEPLFHCKLPSSLELWLILTKITSSASWSLYAQMIYRLLSFKSTDCILTRFPTALGSAVWVFH